MSFSQPDNSLIWILLYSDAFFNVIQYSLGTSEEFGFKCEIYHGTVLKLHKNIYWHETDHRDFEVSHFWHIHPNSWQWHGDVLNICPKNVLHRALSDYIYIIYRVHCYKSVGFCLCWLIYRVRIWYVLFLCVMMVCIKGWQDLGLNAFF